MNQEIKRWLLSSLVTFVAGFSMVFLGGIDDLTLDSIKSGGLVGLAFLAARSGFKALLEAFITWYSRRQFTVSDQQ